MLYSKKCSTFAGVKCWFQETIIETTYSDGSKKREKSNDIIDFLLGSVIVPLAMHFVVEPLLWAAAIYYPLMCIVALIGAVLPYIFPYNSACHLCYYQRKYVVVVADVSTSMAGKIREYQTQSAMCTLMKMVK